MTTGFVYDPAYLAHDTGIGHPERSERLAYTMAYLEKQAWFSALKRVPARKAERQWIDAIHSEAYLQRAAATCRAGEPYLDVPDVAISPESFDTALLAAGAPLQLADEIIAGRIDNGFALVRPPGHHAEADRALGFCLLNNVAITARYLQKRHGLDNILILDWDVHHGNGTQHSFEEDPSVLYISTHQYPFYPGTGAASETGRGPGVGFTLNCPMPAGAGDRAYELAFREKILPKIDAFKPRAVILSAGFDAHKDDPLADIRLSTEFFGWMTQRVMEKAELYAEGRIISVLEGGYNLQALPLCIGVHLSALAG